MGMNSALLSYCNQSNAKGFTITGVYNEIILPYRRSLHKQWLYGCYRYVSQRTGQIAMVGDWYGISQMILDLFRKEPRYVNN